MVPCSSEPPYGCSCGVAGTGLYLLGL
ncbi:hypothetical protein A2U01_0108315, partial [Trifolium medium]|nr:hypothetical protein [Trifolium medium]